MQLKIGKVPMTRLPIPENFIGVADNFLNQFNVKRINCVFPDSILTFTTKCSTKRNQNTDFFWEITKGFSHFICLVD